MTTLKKMILVAGTIAAITLVACSPSVNTIENANAGVNKILLKDKRVITDWGTENFADIAEIRTGTTPDGKNLRVQIEVVNTDDDIGRLAYCVEWFDAQGLKIEIPSAWIPLVIQPEKRKTITLVAPISEAKDFRVSMMRNK